MTSRAVLRNVLLAAVVMAGVSAAAELELTDRTFEDAVAQHPNGLLVEFYAPWCGHCKALAPEFSAACAKLGRKKVNKEPVVPLPCAIIDAEKNTDVAKRYKISGFPWVKLFKARQPAGEPVNYPDNMPRKEASIVAWARQKAGRDVRQVGYSDELTSLRSGGGLLLLGVFGGEAGAAGARRAGEAELVGLSTEGEVSTAFAVHDVGAAQPAGGAAHESILTEALAAEVYADVDSLDRVMADDPREFALPAPALLAFLTTPDGVAHPPAALKPVDLWLATASDELLGEHGPGADAVAALVRQELELLYGQHSPTKAPEALKLLEKYQGNEIALLRAVRDKYGEDGDTALKRAVSVALLPRPVVEFSEAIRPWAFAHPSAYLCVLFRKKGDITHAPAEEEFHAAAAATSGMHAHKKLVFMQVDTGQFMNVAGHFGVKAVILMITCFTLLHRNK
jgi:protein disulfide-isomerase-like protein